MFWHTLSLSLARYSDLFASCKEKSKNTIFRKHGLGLPKHTFLWQESIWTISISIKRNFVIDAALHLQNETVDSPFPEKGTYNMSEMSVSCPEMYSQTITQKLHLSWASSLAARRINAKSCDCSNEETCGHFYDWILVQWAFLVLPIELGIPEW